MDQNDDMKTLSDPEDKIIFEMHQYFNADGSGSQTCVSPTIGQERLVTATDWLRTNGKLGIIGEFSGYADETCQAAVENMVKYLTENSDVGLAPSCGQLGHGGETVFTPTNRRLDLRIHSTSQY